MFPLVAIPPTLVAAALGWRLWHVGRAARLSERRLAARADEVQALLEAVPAAIWISHDVECRVVTGNAIAAKLIGTPESANHSLSHPDPAIGHTPVDAGGARLPTNRLPLQRTIAGEIVEGEPLHLRLDGGRRIELLVSTRRLTDADGKVRGAILAGADTTELHAAERRRALLLSLADALRAEPNAAIELAAGALVRHLGVTRAGFGEVEVGADAITVLGEVTDGSVAPARGTYRLTSFGEPAVTMLGQGDVIAIDDTATHPWTSANAERHISIGTRAVVSVPLLRNGALAATCYLHHAAPRAWSEDEIALVRDVGERGWAVLERARAETARALSESRLRAIYDAATVGLVFAEAPSGRIVSGNARTEEIFGHPVLFSVDAESYGEWVAFHPDGRRVESREYPLARVIAGEPHPTIKCHYQRGDGQRLWVEIAGAAVRDDAGWLTGALVTIADIDKAERDRIALAERTRELERIAFAAPAAIYINHRRERRTVFASDGIERLLGYTAAEIMALPPGGLLTLAHPDDLPILADLMARTDTLADGEAAEVEFRVRHRAGHHVWLLDRVVIYQRDANGHATHVLGCAIDVSARHAAEQELRTLNADLASAIEERTAELVQLRKIETIGQLTGGVAHDMNNLLTPIVGSLDMLSRREQDARSARLIDGAMQAADRARTLVARLLAFARRQPLAPRAVDIGQLVHGIEELASRTVGPQYPIDVRVGDGPVVARVDPGQLETALLNLIVNARDAMPGGGAITIDVALQSVVGPHRARLAPGDYVRVCVEDHGSGMDTDTAARAVEPFFTTKEVGRGTGLGLSMVYGLAAQSGGGMAIDSVPGQGTTIHLWFPAAAEADAAAAAASSADPALAAGMPRHRGVGRSLLLVDDEPLVRRTVAEALREANHSVVEAADGALALELVRAGLRPDALVTDHLMPGMRGNDLVPAIRALLPGLPALLITGFADVGATDGLARLEKPFRPDALIAAVDALFHARTPGADEAINDKG